LDKACADNNGVIHYTDNFTDIRFFLIQFP